MLVSFVIRECSPFDDVGYEVTCLVRESEGLGAQVCFTASVVCYCNAFKLINSHDIVCHYAYACCELASTFNVLTWRVMPDFR